jgi:hypothetical protein
MDVYLLAFQKKANRSNPALGRRKDDGLLLTAQVLINFRAMYWQT